jgi:hypothetical protein
MFRFLTFFVSGILMYPAQGVPHKPDNVWYTGSRTIDLNRDGRQDSVIVQATGRSSDSLTITLAFRVDRQLVWLEKWESSYELVDPPPFPNGVSGQDAYVKKALVDALNSVSVESFRLDEYASMSNSIDSTLVLKPPDFQVSFSYGYETTVVLYWDPGASKFKLAWVCC